jgi:hypothetical protein
MIIQHQLELHQIFLRVKDKFDLVFFIVIQTHWIFNQWEKVFDHPKSKIDIEA